MIRGLIYRACYLVASWSCVVCFAGSIDAWGETVDESLGSRGHQTCLTHSLLVNVVGWSPNNALRDANSIGGNDSLFGTCRTTFGEWTSAVE